MLVISHESKPGVKFGLKPGVSYKVGRERADFCFKDDTSISRNHATIRAENDGVHVKDIGSKYGTYVGEKAVQSSSQNNNQVDKLKKNEEKVAPLGERFRIGLLSTLFKVEKIKLVVSTSSLSKSEKTIVEKSLNSLGPHSAQLVTNWQNDLTHLVVKDGKLTIKVANALAKCVPIVTIEFFQDYAQCLETHQQLPDPKNYVPPMKETRLSAAEANLGINPQRNSVFKGKVFIFENQSQMAKFKDAIEYAGGDSRLIKDSKLAFENPENILVQSDRPEPIKKYEDGVKIVQNNDLSAIKDSDIALAILNASCSVHCNPTFKQKILPSQKKSQGRNKTLAPETQTQSEAFSEQISTLSSTVHIPDTVRQTLDTAKSSVSSVDDQADDGISQAWNSFGNTPKLDEFKEPERPKDPSPVRIKESNSFFEDDDDIFNFDEPEPGPSNKRKRSEPEEIQAKKPKVQSPEKVTEKPRVQTPEKEVENVIVKQVVETPEKSSSGEFISPPSGKIQKTLNSTKSGFICKSTFSCSAVTIKSEIPEEELSKSFTNIEIRSLVVKKKPNESISSTFDQNLNVKNVKRFKKQAIAKSDKSVSCTANESPREKVETVFETSRDKDAVMEEQEEDDLWNFESQGSQSTSRKRKR